MGKVKSSAKTGQATVDLILLREQLNALFVLPLKASQQASLVTNKHFEILILSSSCKQPEGPC